MRSWSASGSTFRLACWSSAVTTALTSLSSGNNEVTT